jgi:hypothetical protein
MLNLCRYVAVAMMLLATVDLALNVYGLAAPLWAASKEASDDDSAAAPAEYSTEGSAEDKTPFSQQVTRFVTSLVNAVASPLTFFCYGATLFVLVRIARDQAHDLATG